MTDLLQTAVNTGTGRAAQIGRPVAGKTGTTSSNKDGWFLGFSSGITTGVWMGRDDARAVAGLQGGAAPARAFAAYMRAAVAGRPIEQFRTEVELPQWQLEGDDQAYYGDPVTGGVDENGNPIETDPNAPGKPESNGESSIPPDKPGDSQQLDQQWIDQVTGRRDGSGAGAPPARRNPA
jgi:penicillin-binding protein 1A